MDTSSLGIRLDGVSATFRHARRADVTAVRDLDLDIRPGEFLTLLGASGCGKTTVLRMIAGFQRPSAGRVLFGERDVTGEAANRRDVGFVFQNYALFPHLSVFENVAYGLRVKRLPGADIASSVEAGLRQVGLAGLSDRMISELSGGQQQRVALARAIVIQPRVLLFDEPLSNLDAQLRVQMRSEIRRLQRELDITTVYVTHDQEEAMAISDRIAIMNAGRIVQIGTAEELYQRPGSAFAATFLGEANLIKCRIVEVAMDLLTLGIGDIALGHFQRGTRIGRRLMSRPWCVPRPSSCRRRARDFRGRSCRRPIWDRRSTISCASATRPCGSCSPIRRSDRVSPRARSWM